MQTKNFTQEELQTIIEQMEFMKKSPLKKSLTTEIHLGNGTSAQISVNKDGNTNVSFKVIESGNYFDR